MKEVESLENVLNNGPTSSQEEFSDEGTYSENDYFQHSDEEAGMDNNPRF